MKKFKLTRRALAVGVSAAAVTLAGPAVAGDEIEDRGPYYEDDAWYDISEWFDGNDYNPTDEAIGRIDDETYDASEDTGGDFDNDTWFGYDGRYDADNWFYDYYDDGNMTSIDRDRDGVYEHAYWYIDRDGDGLYDGWYHLNDTNGDGTFEAVSFFALNDRRSSADRSASDTRWWSKAQAERNSKRQSVKGTVAATKKVSVRDTKHLCVSLKKADGTKCMADLGPVSNLDELDIEAGDQIAVHGPMSRVGGKPILLAQTVKAHGETASVDRNHRALEGTVVGTHPVQLRGREHLILIVAAKNGKKCAVDAGPRTGALTSLSPGDTVTAHGAMVKADGRRMLFANTIKCDGESFNVERRMGATRTSRK